MSIRMPLQESLVGAPISLGALSSESRLWMYFGPEFSVKIIVEFDLFSLSLGFYGAFLSAVAGRMVLVTLLLAASTFLLVLQITEARTKKDQMQSKNLEQRFHLYSLIALAFCAVFIALSVSSSASRIPLHGRGGFPSSPALAKQQSPKDHSSGGYHLIVLWPLHKEDKITPSLPRKIDALSPGVTKPWIIPFYGPYWYFKFSGESPGPDAQTTRGDPLKVNVHSTDSGQLLMEAHQNLSAPIDLACCSEMEVVFRNDMSFGAFAIGLSLTDSQRKLSQNLGVSTSLRFPLNEVRATHHRLRRH